jgi:hypothetical protein
VSVRRGSVAEVGRQHPAPNKLVRSAPKRVAVRVNGGLARRSHRRESVGGGVERNDVWRVGSHAFLKGVRDRLRPRTA